MYVDVSENECKTLQVFNHLPALVQLNASDNALTECLDFSPPKCDETKSWSTGKHAIGSMLTLANLSSNKITSIRDLSDHPFLECLLLGKNSITKISGISSLKYLKVLDLSYNSITQIEGLDGLLLEELNLEGNAISSLKGLDQLHRLSALNANKNKISSLAPLKSSKALTSVCVEHNDITNISEVEALSDLPFLQLLKMYNNPCCKKPFFRERCVYRVPTLAQLNETIVTAEEKIRSANVYLDASRGDLSCREEIAHNNNRDFENYGDVLDDEELVDKRITRISEDVEVEDEAELEDLMEAANIMLKTETGDDDAIVSGEGDYDTDKVEQTAQLSAEVM
jgi:Leucine-rich repeat (LRR) protein